MRPDTGLGSVLEQKCESPQVTFSLPICTTGCNVKKNTKSDNGGTAIPTRTRKTPDPQGICFNNVTYSDSNVEVRLEATELTRLVKALAAANGHAYSDLMANEEILPGVPLKCRLIKTLPRGFSFMTGRRDGYIQPKLRGRCCR